MNHVLAIDQSTTATKAILFGSGGIVCRRDVAHNQIILPNGWIEHDPAEIYENLLQAVRQVISDSGVDKGTIIGAGITNQRETVLAWDKISGKPVYNAVTWQCSRGAEICSKLQPHGELIRQITGLPLSPYFSAPKLKWILDNAESLPSTAAGTMDSWLLYKLCGVHKTDVSNAARTMLFDINTLKWSDEACSLFGIDPSLLPEVCDSDARFGESVFGGLFDKPIPVVAVMGDSNSALFAHGCFENGDVKITYGTGSSVMMNAGGSRLRGADGLAVSLAWKRGNEVRYVLEGNINYCGAIAKWLCREVGIIASPQEIGELAEKANPADTTYIIPAFSGLGAPHWIFGAKARITGMTLATGRAEIAKAAEEAVCFQVCDIIDVMRGESGSDIRIVNADGGMVNDTYLMQLQSDFLNADILASDMEELSAAGVAYMAGAERGVKRSNRYAPCGSREYHIDKYGGWKKEIALLRP